MLDEAARLDQAVASLYGEGKLREAIPLAERSLELREEALGPRHPDVAKSLHSLASLYEAQGDYARAEPLYLRALDIREQALGPTHSDVTRSLRGLASLYHARGAYARAEPLLVQALALQEQALGPTHPEVAQSLHSLATLYQEQGAYVQAEPLLVRALAIREQALGPTHPEVARSLRALARVYHAQGAYARAEPLLMRALALQEQALGPTHPEVARSLHNLAALYHAQGDHARAEPLLVRALALQEQALGSMHPDVLRSLGDLAALHQAQGAAARAVPLLARIAEAREARLQSELAYLSMSRKELLLKLLREETERLISLQAHEVPADPRALELALTTILRRKGRALDSAAGSSLHAAGSGPRAPAEPVTIAQIQAALPPRAALVEIVRYHRFDPRRAHGLQEERYLAYLLPRQGPPRWVALGDAARIDAGVDAALAALRKDTDASAAKVALRSLDALVFAPIRDRLTGVSHVILSPDGELSFVPFEALIDPRGRHALEQWLVSYVTSGRDLLRLAARQAPRSPVTVVADPEYGPGTQFSRLAGTLAEVQAIQRHFPDARTLTGQQATKAALAAVAGPAVLHIATSGFHARGAAAAPSDPDAALDRAGLALAGANARPDGIVSAREIAGFDWSGTQLVVLSSSESGVGVAPPGEGVYGLRRALVLAGAQAQVVSLWSIDAASTPELMRELYTELARGTGRAEALRQAKLRILRQPRFAHPYYWAAFVFTGDWTPLDKGAARKQEPGR